MREASNENPTFAARHRLQGGHADPSAGEIKYPRVFAKEDRKGTPLLTIVTDGSQIELLKKLMYRMPDPFWLLYVLRVSRGEGSTGRYQSANSLLRTDVRTLLDRYKGFLESDSRHNFWIKSVDSPALLVLDEHNFIHCYGPVDAWAKELEGLGWQECQADENLLPDPHVHHYHPIFDDEARDLLANVEWIYSPLHEQDL